MPSGATRTTRTDEPGTSAGPAGTAITTVAATSLAGAPRTARPTSTTLAAAAKQPASAAMTPGTAMATVVHAKSQGEFVAASTTTTWPAGTAIAIKERMAAVTAAPAIRTVTNILSERGWCGSARPARSSVSDPPSVAAATTIREQAARTARTAVA